jgi:amidase/aspartyl-tRNA(Asn)/glutamyl-tRNA(Gln) amidotransferase subunit A
MRHAITGFAGWRELGSTDTETVRARFRERLSDFLPEASRPAIAFVPEEIAHSSTSEPDQTWTEKPLAGVPFLVKDLYDVAGWPTRASSRFLESEIGIPTHSSPLVEELVRLGATAVGKTHLNEFAYGMSGFNPHYGDCPHPRFADRVSGGSSSGSAWAVGSNLVPLALGTGTGGSIRVPAAFCGVYGLRLTPNKWSREGCFPLSPGLDTPGWFTCTAEDMCTLIRLLLLSPPAGESDETDAGLADSTDSLGGVVLEPEGISPHPDLGQSYADYMDMAGLDRDPDLLQQFHEVARRLPKHYAVIQSREAFEVHKEWLDRFRDMYDPAVWQRIDRGRNWDESEVAEAEEARDRARLFFAELFGSYDYAILPATTMPAPKKSEWGDAIRSDLLTVTSPASLATLPVLTVPVMLDDGLSGGFQIIYSDPASDLPLRFLESIRGADPMPRGSVL